MHTVKILSTLIENHQILAYLVILVGLIFEGEIILIVTGVLAHLGAIDFHVALIFILLGGFGKTFIGYFIGKTIYNKWNTNNLIKYIERKISIIVPHFKKKPFWSIFISKFILGANNIVIIFSGYKNIPLKVFLKAETISTIIWAPLLLSLGFFFSYTAINITIEISRFSLIVLLLIIIFIIIHKLVTYTYELLEGFHNHENE